MRFVDPKNDVAFKKIFGDEDHKEVLIAFLNAVLELRGAQQIVDVTILNPYQAPRLVYLKYTTLDIRAIDQRGNHFIVEMQVEAAEGAKERFQYYVAKTYSGQIARAEEYDKLKPVYFIGILDFTLFESKKYLSRHLILNLENHDQDLDAVEFYFIELPKFSKKADELTTPLDKWVYFIKYAEDLTVMPESADTDALKTAYSVAESYRWSEMELEVYDYWGMKRQDERGAIVAGEKRGMEIGHKQGVDEGRKENQLANARAMLQDGMDKPLVVKYTGLTLEELADLSPESTPTPAPNPQ